MITTKRLWTIGESQTGGGAAEPAPQASQQVPPGATPGPPSAGATPEDEPGEQDLGDAGKRTLGRLRAANKQLADQIKELTAFKDSVEEAKLSDQEKAAKQLQEAQAAEQAASLKAARYEAAAAVPGFPLQMAPRLQGNSPEELVDDAKKLLAVIGQRTPTSPAPDPGAGAGQGNRTPVNLQEAVAAHYQAG